MKCAIALLAMLTGMRPAAAQAPDTIPLADRVWMASSIHTAVDHYFAHWQAIPEHDPDAAYRDYLAQVLASSDRRSFSLASMAYLATLRNGHTDFTDQWLWQHDGADVGFQVQQRRGERGGEWVVVSSRRAGISPGDVIDAVDGMPVADFVRPRVRYAQGSSEAVREQRVFRTPFLLPRSFRLRLRGGSEVQVVRGEGLGPAPAGRALESRELAAGVPYIRVRSFDDPSIEERTVAMVKEHATSPVLIIDVRENGGGTTPVALIEALMDRPYVDWTESTIVSNALFGAYRDIKQTYSKKQLGEYTAGYVDGLGSFDRAEYRTLGRVVQPGTPVFTGRLIVLIDQGCASACEDFVMPLSMSGRATLVGEPTLGSTGQPYMHNFGNGMSFRISTKRVYFPDGRTFEGVGIRPDVAVEPTPADLRAKRDVMLERALELARANAGR